MGSPSTMVHSLRMVRIVVAGFGNVLRGDDGVGVRVIEHLVGAPVPDGVELLEIGSGGIHLVQSLLDPTSALVVVDAVSLGRRPGSVVVMRPDVIDPKLLDIHERRDRVGDMHLANPDRALTVARGLGVLPGEVWLVGVEPTDDEAWGETLTEPVASAVRVAADQVRRTVSAAGIPWPAPDEA